MSAPGAGGDGAAKPARPFPAQPRIQPMQATPRPVVRPFQAQSASQSAAAQAVPVQAQPIPVKPMPRAVPAGAPQPPAVRPSAPPPAPPRAPGGMAPANVRPTVPAANPRKRHWLLLASFLGIVVLPTIFWAWYLWARATDQYVSTVGFSVHKEEISPAIDLLGGLAPLAGGSGPSDTDVLYEYIRSQDMVEKIDAQLDLRQKFSRDWPHDFVFAYDPDGQIEDLTDYWSRQVKVLYDTSSDLITLKINAFTAEDAQQIAAAVFQQSSDKINELSSIARNDSTRLARDELEQTRQDLTQVRQDMTQFRMRTQIVDPQADLTSQMGVLSGLQAQLAEALVAHDLLLDNARPTDHRVTQSQQKIDALRRLIDSERQKFGADGKGPTGESYSALMAEYEKLMVDREFAEGAYRAARVAYEAAMAEARRKSRYLAAHIEPKIAQSSQAPNRPWLLFVVAGLLLTCWSIIALIYYSIRDRA
ncbi:capsular polysaccharide transport system permease protein [Paracoccus laeviglucosivorans]|uniref:Capsular polysaccharide transport system permease protein n=2 Tax=Paracoccus laeviglucosivorans TaxID=1197861 RepID=A0A521DBN0_9RHOB|nr:capsular polysaccharide transport system permease protein [Paracoccus laeviglucosivorans]